MEFRIYEKIKEAFGYSAHSNNKFKSALESIAWDYSFFADGEHYFVKGGLTITTPSLNPFDMDWRPSAMFSDGSVIEF